MEGGGSGGSDNGACMAVLLSEVSGRLAAAWRAAGLVAWLTGTLVVKLAVPEMWAVSLAVAL